MAKSFNNAIKGNPAMASFITKPEDAEKPQKAAPKTSKPKKKLPRVIGEDQKPSRTKATQAGGATEAVITHSKEYNRQKRTAQAPLLTRPLLLQAAKETAAAEGVSFNEWLNEIIEAAIRDANE